MENVRAGGLVGGWVAVCVHGYLSVWEEELMLKRTICTGVRALCPTSSAWLFAVATMMIPCSARAQTPIATNCTLYAAANGNDANSGTSPTAPKTLRGASQASGP